MGKFNLILILFIFISLVSNGEIVRLKFKIYNQKDSTEISITKFQIKPIKSYWVEEIEHHKKNAKEHNFKTFRFYRDKEASCNIFEFEKSEYPYNDIYLKVESDSFYYNPIIDEYEDPHCIHLKVNNNVVPEKVFVSSYRFVNIIYGGDVIKRYDCINLYLMGGGYNNDTVTAHPSKIKAIPISIDSLIKTFALTPKMKLFLFVELYNAKEYVYCYYDLNSLKEVSQNIYLQNLDYKEFNGFYTMSECIKPLEYMKKNKSIEYYEEW